MCITIPKSVDQGAYIITCLLVPLSFQRFKNSERFTIPIEFKFTRDMNIGSIKVVADVIQKHFPDVKVFPAVGNHEVYFSDNALGQLFCWFVVNILQHTFMVEFMTVTNGDKFPTCVVSTLWKSSISVDATSKELGTLLFSHYIFISN